jgi:hypothetical protein
MAYVSTQRFITGLPVFDTYSGLDGSIVLVNLDVSSVHALAPLYTGAHFVVNFSDSSLQVFTVEGKRVDHTTGNALAGVTLLTKPEKTALLGAGYPAK